jgi:hypothetical protein
MRRTSLSSLPSCCGLPGRRRSPTRLATRESHELPGLGPRNRTGHARGEWRLGRSHATSTYAALFRPRLIDAQSRELNCDRGLGVSGCLRKRHPRGAATTPMHLVQCVLGQLCPEPAGDHCQFALSCRQNQVRRACPAPDSLLTRGFRAERITVGGWGQAFRQGPVVGYVFVVAHLIGGIAYFVDPSPRRRGCTRTRPRVDETAAAKYRPPRSELP